MIQKDTKNLGKTLKEIAKILRDSVIREDAEGFRKSFGKIVKNADLEEFEKKTQKDSKRFIQFQKENGKILRDSGSFRRIVQKN